MADNLKVKVGADIQGLKKGMNEAASTVKGFGGNLSGLTGPLGQVLDSANNIGSKFVDIGAAAGKSASAMKTLGTIGAAAGGAIAAGLLAAKAVLSEMNTLAEHYRNTMQGVVDMEGVKAYADTYNAVINDTIDGKGASDFKNKWNKKWKEIGANYRLLFKSFFDTDVAKDYLTLVGQAAEKAKQAESLARERAEAANRLIKSEQQIYDINTKIASLRLVLINKENSAVERMAAGAEIQKLIEEKYAIQAHDLEIIYRKTKAINDLAENGRQDWEAENKAYESWMSLAEKRDNALREVMEPLNAARKESRNNPVAISVRAPFEEVPEVANDLKKMIGEIQAEVQTPVTIDVELNKQSVQMAEIQMQDVVGILMGFAEDVAGIFGEAIGNALTGNTADIGTDLLAAVGNLMVKFGELAVACGVAAMGIMESIRLNPFLAIGAGLALIALGKAVSTAASNLASGVGNSSVSSNSASYMSNSSSGSDLSAVEINVNVGGTLQANGSTLLAVINNENKRLNHTT